MAFFSVVMPVYNRASLIQTAIASVLAQTFADYELIVVDDGSTDNTVEVVQTYPQVRCIQQPNQGPGTARNLGIQVATGQYVAFLDSDDEWFPWTLATYKQIIDHYHSPAFVAGAFCNLTLTEPKPVPAQLQPSVQSYADFYSCPGMPFYSFTTSSVVIKTEVLCQVGGFSQLRTNYEDMDLWLRLGTASGYIFIESPACAIRWFHDDNICFSRPHNRRGVQLLIDTEKQAQYPGSLDRLRDRRDKLCSLLRAASVTFATEKRWQDALYIYWETWLWQLQLKRWQYTLGFPLLAFSKLVK